MSWYKINNSAREDMCCDLMQYQNKADKFTLERSIFFKIKHINGSLRCNQIKMNYLKRNIGAV